MTTAGSMAWLVSLTPVFSALLARALLRESLGLRKVAGILLAAAGAVGEVMGVDGTERGAE